VEHVSNCGKELGVARRNLTVQLDEETIRQARILAAERGTSVSGLVARELEQLVARNARYEEAMRRAIELMGKSEPRGGRTWRRDDLYQEWPVVAERQVTFVDTNVLAYAYDRSETGKQPVARIQLEALWRERTGAVSTQVLQEFYVVATRKLATPMPARPPERSSSSTVSGQSCRSTFRFSSAHPSSRSATGSRSGTPSSSRRPIVPAQPGC
jgi:hypothetical protein